MVQDGTKVTALCSMFQLVEHEVPQAGGRRAVRREVQGAAGPRGAPPGLRARALRRQRKVETGV